MSDQTVKTPQVAQGLSNLEKKIYQVLETQNQLREKLLPILRPAKNKTEQEAEEALIREAIGRTIAEELCPLAACLTSIEAVADNILISNQQIIRSLEL